MSTAPLLLAEDSLPPLRFEHPQATHRLLLGPAQVAYELRRSARRSIGLSIGPEGLRVSAPRWTPQAEIEAVLHQKTRWVLDKLAQARQRQQQQAAQHIAWGEGAQLPYLGQPLQLLRDARQSHGLRGAVLQAAEGGQPARLHLGLPAQASTSQWRDAAQAWLMRQARRHFTARLDHFAPSLGVRWQQLSLSNAQTRWGSASASGRIRLNWRLIHLRESLIDYVVVHELAHLREMNHSPRFWQHVHNALPDCQQRRQDLRQQHLPPW